MSCSSTRWRIAIAMGCYRRILTHKPGRCGEIFPQTYSMAGLILTAMRLSRSWEDRYWRGCGGIESRGCPEPRRSSRRTGGRRTLPAQAARPLVRLERNRFDRRRRHHRTIQQGDMSYVLTDLVEADYQEYYNGFANRCCGRSCTTASTWRSSRAAISAAIGASTRILPTSSLICCSPTTSSGCTTIISFRWRKCCATAATATASDTSCMCRFRPRDRHRAAQPRMADSAACRLRSGRPADRQRRDQSWRAISRTNADCASEASSCMKPPIEPCVWAPSRSASRPASSTAWRGVRCARRWCAAWWRASPGAR